MTSWISAALQAAITSFETGMRVCHEQIVVERAGKQHGFLRHHSESRSQFVGGEMTDVLAVERDLTFHRLIEAEQQFRQRALAAARRTHDDGQLARWESQGQISVEPRMLFGVAESKVF
jgi:hypothetical protein